METRPYVRNGTGTVRPYVYGPAGLLPWLEQVFAAAVVESSPDGGEVQARIGDSIVALALGDEFPAGAGGRSSLYVYVEDVDATFAAALSAGATGVTAPEDKPYGERQGCVRDHHGNTWYIATFTGQMH